MKNNTTAAKVLQPLISLMENGSLPPWKKGWKSDLGQPINAATGKAYGGANRLLLMLASLEKGDSRFLGMRQANNLGGRIRAGSKSVPILIPIMKTFDSEDPMTGETTKAQVAYGFRVGRVFSIQDCEGIDQTKVVQLEAASRNNDPIQAAEEFIGCHTIDIRTGVAPAYSPQADAVFMPSISSFDSSEGYYSTLLHEVGHWTGHESRLNRLEPARFGTDKYSREELVAELFACFARSELGFENDVEVYDSAAYLKGWLDVLREQPSMLWQAAGQAEKAVTWFKANGKSQAMKVAA